MTLAQIRKLPALLDVTEAAAVLGVSRSAAYDAIRADRFSAKTIKVGGRVKVLTASLVRVLEDGETARPA